MDVRKTSTEIAKGKPDYWSILVFYNGIPTIVKEQQAAGAALSPTGKITFPAQVEMSDEEKKIYQALKHWRADKAQTLNLPTFLVCSNAQLAAVAKVKPQSLEDLNQIKGFGGQKSAKHGGDIIALLNSVS